MNPQNRIQYRTVAVNGLDIFYREAGPAEAPVLLLLHGFPTSSHMFRNLIPLLADRYRVVAPDLPGFGFTTSPPTTAFAYTFDHLAEVIDRFTQVLGLARYALYVFDYGAPVGFRLALAHPERVTALITQNGNAYEEGLSGEWAAAIAYWQHPTPENRAVLREMHTWDFIQLQYRHGTPDPTQVAPEAPVLDFWGLSRAGYDEMQLDLILDYRTNVALYPRFQEYFRSQRPPTLAVWGENDPYFLPAGAHAYRRDNPAAQVHLLPTGHFALETHVAEIASLIRAFLLPVLGEG
ncbi:alpha/beta hydrolase [Hymenobacter sp. YC55]|uniref:alpha/beta fold hydrolase n=1 Tax=Hymenobacter sp. YC55 TaxID=3034019 RepID=UPI0023FA0FB7|nr:alpha/beta hydrolase [Hymenobacter sp. YC55]MDF7814217.1 alpha/beta hydrolase [Hymenobacter sp. YC55]